MDKKFCPYCMTKITEGETCPNCKLTDGAYTPKPFHIPPGSVLRERYLVGKVLGEGGFGITYIGCDIQLEMKVAIKEYYPSDRVHRDSSQSLNVGTYVGELERSYEKGKQRFLDEARVMARLTKEPAIVRVQDFFEMNNTAYIVMEYIEGTTLSDLAKQKGGKVPPAELFSMVEPLFRALGMMHEKNLVHRDISPDNIMIESGMVRLLDFGCAREAIDKNETLTIQLKHGYAPIEQYQNKGQGPWTDVYAFAATLYFCLTGMKPPQALDRIMTDNLLRPTKLGVGLSDQQEKALLRALTVVPNRRTQSMEEFHAELYQSVKLDPIEKGSLVVKTSVSGTEIMPEVRLKIALTGSGVDPDGVYGDVELNGGIAEITVKGGENVLASGIPAGTEYKVECEEIADFTVTSTRPDGTIEKDAALAATFEFTAVEKPVGSLAISSRMIGADGEEHQVKYTVTLSGDSVDPNGTYGDVVFKDGVAELVIAGSNSVVISGLPAGASYKIAGESLEDFKLSSSRSDGMIEKDVTKSARFDYKRIKKRFVKAVKQPEPQPIGQTVAIEPKDTAEKTSEPAPDKTVAVEADDVSWADGEIGNITDVPFGHTVAVEAADADAEAISENKTADVRPDENESEAGSRVSENDPVKEPEKKPEKLKKAKEKPAGIKKQKKTEKSDSNDQKIEKSDEKIEKPDKAEEAEKADEPKKPKKPKEDSKESDDGIKLLLVTAALAIGALLIILVLVLFGIVGNRNKDGDVIFSHTVTLKDNGVLGRMSQTVLDLNTDEYKDFLVALTESGSQVRAEFSVEPNWVEMGFEYTQGENQRYKASSAVRDGKVVTWSGAEFIRTLNNNGLKGYDSRLYISGLFPKNNVKLKLYVIKTGEIDPDGWRNDINLDLPEYEIFHYDFTDGNSDNSWEDTELNSYTDIGREFLNAIRVKGARIVVHTDLTEYWQYMLWSHWLGDDGNDYDEGVVISTGFPDYGDLSYEKVIDNGDRTVVIINAGLLVRVFESKGYSFDNNVRWVNGADDGNDTYSISVYASTPDIPQYDPEPDIPEEDMGVVFSYTVNLTKDEEYGWALGMLEPWNLPDEHAAFLDAIYMQDSWLEITLSESTDRFEFGVQHTPFKDDVWFEGDWTVDYIDGKFTGDRYTVSGEVVRQHIDDDLASGWINVQPFYETNFPDDATVALTLTVLVPKETGAQNLSEPLQTTAPAVTEPPVTTTPTPTTTVPTTTAPPATTPTPTTTAEPETTYQRPKAMSNPILQDHTILFDFGDCFTDEEVTAYNIRYPGYVPLFSPLYAKQSEAEAFGTALTTSGAKIVVYHDGDYTPNLYLIDRNYPETPEYSYKYQKTYNTTNGRQVTVFDCDTLVKTLHDNDLEPGDIVGLSVNGKNVNIYGAQILLGKNAVQPTANKTSDSSDSQEIFSYSRTAGYDELGHGWQIPIFGTRIDYYPTTDFLEAIQQNGAVVEIVADTHIPWLTLNFYQAADDLSMLEVEDGFWNKDTYTWTASGKDVYDTYQKGSSKCIIVIETYLPMNAVPKFTVTVSVPSTTELV